MLVYIVYRRGAWYWEALQGGHTGDKGYSTAWLARRAAKKSLQRPFSYMICGA